MFVEVEQITVDGSTENIILNTDRILSIRPAGNEQWMIHIENGQHACVASSEAVRLYALLSGDGRPLAPDSALSGATETAKAIGEQARVAFDALRKDFGVSDIKEEEPAKFLELGDWNACEKIPPELSWQPFDDPRRNMPLFIGVAIKPRGISAIVSVFTRGEVYAVEASFFAPSAVVRMDARLHGFMKSGHLKEIVGDVVPLSALVDSITRRHRPKQVACVAYDPWEADELPDRLYESGYDSLKVRQLLDDLDQPTRKIRQAVALRTLFHNGDRLMQKMVEDARLVCPEKNAAQPGSHIRISEGMSKGHTSGPRALVRAFYAILQAK